ncbi:nuclear transport factor 2 family protein [Sphingomonas sp.]|jgi:hypothetical protein|uniref:nuclear transport factor 2 family protein n=1 Tax=Sphingomonas sp. TaxID=28214 RepID=UPI0035C7EE84
MPSREEIESALHRLNAAENSRPTATVEEISSKIDQIMAPDVEGWRNGAHVSSREAEREVEKKAFGALTDYHRTFEKMLIDPPLATITWTIRGTFAGKPVEAPGCSTFEFNDEGRARKYWMYFDPAHFSYRS